MFVWPWESAQHKESVEKLAQEIAENKKLLQKIQSDLAEFTNFTIDSIESVRQDSVTSTAEIRQDITKLSRENDNLQEGYKKTAEGLNHMWYLMGDSTSPVKTGYLKRFGSWARDFVFHHHLLIVSWVMFAGTLAAAVYIFLVNTGGI